MERPILVVGKRKPWAWVRSIHRPSGFPVDLVPTPGVATENGLYQSDDEGETYSAAAAFNGLSVWSIARTSDGNTPWAPHVEMEDIVAAGMTPAQVLVACTQNSAAVLGLSDLGAIKPGKSADFIVLKGNPLDDITNTRRIASVYLRGEKVDRTRTGAR